MSTLFTKIYKGEIPSYKIAENDQCYAFLDINPSTEGHTLVIPKLEVDHLFDLEESTFVALMQFSRKIAKAIEQVIPCKRVGMSVIGLEVPHAHVHLIPIYSMDDMRFIDKKVLDTEAFQNIALKITESFNKQP